VGKIQGAGQGKEISKLPKFHRTSPVDHKRPPGAAEVPAYEPWPSRSLIGRRTMALFRFPTAE
jgi:hypothetical protein